VKKPALALLSLPLLLITLGLNFNDETNADHTAVEQAVLDYVEGIYDVQPERIERSVHKDMKKYGFWREGADKPYQGMPMTFEQLVELAGKYNAEGRIPEDAPKKVEILDLLDQTAVAKLTASWGIDTFQLAKFDGKWKILHIMWQSHP